MLHVLGQRVAETISGVPLDEIPVGYCQCGCGQKTAITPNTDNNRGYRKGEPKRFIIGHSQRRPFEYSIEDRGFATPCWVWCGDISNWGYGVIKIGATRPPAHRYMWERARGPIPEGLTIDHLCRVPACVNPDHLEPVTQGENNRRRAGHQASGHPSPIRTARVASKMTQKALARAVGVSPQTLYLWETGRNRVSDEMRQRLTRVLGHDPLAGS